MGFQNRRSILGIGSASLFGLSLPHILEANHAKNSSEVSSKAQSMILLWLDGAPSTIDMWDMKPDAPDYVRGDFKAIATKVPGVPICEHLPKLGQLLDRCTLIRSLHHSIPEHGPGSQLMLSGHMPSAAIEYPALGSIAMKMLPPRDSIPQNIVFNKPFALNAGYLGSACNAFELKDSAKLPIGLSLGADVDRERFLRRVNLRNRFDRSFDSVESDVTVASLKQFQNEAKDILVSDAISNALDLSQEVHSVRERYGERSPFGSNVLRARRLVEAGTRFVTVGLSGWDTHTNNFPELRNSLLPQLDAALSSLLRDLDERGLLDSTIVCCCGEFGRTPQVNGAAGRDHWSRAFSALVAGGGFASGLAFGETDANGQQPIANGCKPEDLCATLLHLLGISPSESIIAQSGRPIKIMEQGEVIKGTLISS
jgi:hypothetical protein